MSSFCNFLNLSNLKSQNLLTNHKLTLKIVHLSNSVMFWAGANLELMSLNSIIHTQRSGKSRCLNIDVTDVYLPYVTWRGGESWGNQETTQLSQQGAGLTRDGRFGSKVGQIGPQMGQERQMHWNLIWKSPGFVPFGDNLTHFGAKPTIPEMT